MMRMLMIAGLGAVLSAAPALADGKIYVQLPDLASYPAERSEGFLREIVVANVVSSNCPGYEVTDAEWSLLTDSAHILVKQLGIAASVYNDDIYGGAFDMLDKPDTCAIEGPNVEYVLQELEDWGGSRDPLPDQQAAANAVSNATGGKTKTK